MAFLLTNTRSSLLIVSRMYALPKCFRLANHDTRTELAHVPVRRRVSDEPVHDEFNFARLSMKHLSVAISYVFTRLILQRHFFTAGLPLPSGAMGSAHAMTAFEVSRQSISFRVNS
jgi:hypothetical protein